ncbi:MAG: PorV/PorQ family protein [Flavobacteriales bacterium]|nr:PorV/PorQ family protein [Flavobacteriales bacterium]
MRRLLTFLVAFTLTFYANAQLQAYSNLITTSVPFLSLENNARVLGRGNLGVVAPRGETATAFYSNPALIQTDSRTLNVQATYMPWLRSLVPDISLASIDGSYQLSKAHAIGVNLRYFSLGKIQFTDQFGNSTTQFTPKEFCGQVNYAIKLNENLGVGLAGKFVSSNLTGGQTVGGASSKPGITGAVDIGAIYRRSIATSDRTALELGLGGAIVNLGPKIGYV